MGGDMVSVRIEGTLMKACRRCAYHGERVFTKPRASNKPSVAKTPYISTRSSEKVLDLVEDYARVVRENREAKGLTQDQLGSKINEKGSVISRIESGHMHPNIKVARKLEKFFKIELLEEQ